jgi:hypothetical protein
MLPRLRRVYKSVPFILPVLLLSGYLYSPQKSLRDTMPSSPSSEEVANTLLAKNGLHLQHLKVIQSLWAGYGQICHITALSNMPPALVDSEDSQAQDKKSYILKLITPPPTKANDEGRTRKILSYQVEQYFYSHLAPQLPPSIPVAECLGSINEHHADGTSTTAMLLSDLKQKFPVAGERRNVLSTIQVNAALDWLAGFHGFWWPRIEDLRPSSLVLPPLDEVRRDGQNESGKTVWLNGGYTYLATRRNEYANLSADDDSEWSAVLTRPMGSNNKSIAEMVAAFLAPTISGTGPIERYKTLIHGDVKSENLFTSRSGEEVAFYDFQYVGLGLGVCDLAKLFTCSVPLSILVVDNDIPHDLPMQKGEKALLERYWRRLQETGGQVYDWETFVLHWEIALVDWLRFQASWGFWGNTDWLEARARNILRDADWKEALVRVISTEG